MKLVLHPGHARCGSTTIQSSVYRHADYLRQRHIYIPDSQFQFAFEPQPAQPSQAMHPLRLFQSLMQGQADLSNFTRRLDVVLRHAASSDCETILVSSENLCNLDAPDAGDFHRALASRFQQVRVLYYIRREDDWLQSCWQKFHFIEGMSLRECVAHYLHERAFSFLDNSKHFQELYGQEALSVIPLHPSAWHKGDLLSDFYHRMGVGDPNPEESKTASNRSLNPYLCEVLSRMPTPDGPFDENELRQLLHSCVKSTELLTRRYRRFMDAGLRRQIMTHYESDNRELHRRFFPSLDFDEIFTPSDLPPKEDLPPADLEGVKDILAIQMDILLRLIRDSGNGDRPHTV